jgi:putative nucleotidyltransferase with HDIG domain
VLAYLLLQAVTPIFESMFNRLTDIKLVELASMNHPALRLLATDAPGTFTHSVMVGNLAQAAADAIGANGLLARVGAYYHDLGKTRAPRYFAENQAGENPHDRLKPHLSVLIIKAHVKDGMKILKEFGLPDEIIDFVPQHHGTSLISHFFHRAERERESDEEVLESDFRYPGPKPQRRETALLMLADAVEAAAKALPEPNPVRLHALVKRVIAQKTEDGQFDECDLTLRELAQVEDAFVKALMGIHHVRPVYLGPPQLARPVSQGSQNSDEVRRAALLADGGVGVAVRRNPPAQAIGPGSATTSVHPAAAILDSAEPPQAPTAVVASTRNPSPTLKNLN